MSGMTINRSRFIPAVQVHHLLKYLLKCSISPALLQYPQGAARTLHPPSHHRFQRTMLRLLYLDRHHYTVPNHRALMVHRRLT